MFLYPWYEIVNESCLLQGDILEQFDVLVPVSNTVKEKNLIDSRLKTYDVIVLSQSCDLSIDNNKGRPKLEYVLLCPVEGLDSFRSRVSDFFKSSKGLEQIRQGIIPGLHMLDQCGTEGFQRPVRIVDFHYIFSMPFDYVVESAKDKDRVRLCPPYREHLSQSFARYFMRVGLPISVKQFK